MIAAALAILLAADPVVLPVEVDRVMLEAAQPAPEKSALVKWRYDGGETKGLFLTDDQARRIAERIRAAEDLDQATMAAPGRTWLIGGVVTGLVVGVLAGYQVAKRVR